LVNQFTSTLFLEIAAMAVAYFIFSFIPMRNYSPLDTKTAIAKLILLLAALFFFVPLHPYDHVSLTAIWMLALAFELTGRWIVISGLVVCLRPKIFYYISGITDATSINFHESLVMSIGLFLILLGGTLALLTNRSDAMTISSVSLGGLRDEN
jgi:hypothetical protein